MRERSLFHLKTLISIFAACALLVPSTASARAGAVDPSYRLRYAGFGQEGVGWTLTAEGKLLMVGAIPALGDGSSKVRVARFTRSGALDRSFGRHGNGRIEHPGAERVMVAQRAPDDKLVVVGWDEWARIVVLRLLPNGSLDKTFGANGVVGLGWPTLWANPTHVAIQRDGKVVIAIASWTSGASLAFLRLRADGLADPTFGVGGRAVVEPGGAVKRLSGMALRSDGSIVYAGGVSDADGTPADSFVGRLLPTGVPDPTFGTGGTTRFSFGGDELPGGMIQQRDGKMIVGATIPGAVAFARLTREGALDTTFSGDGKAFAKDPSADHRILDMERASDGTILVALADALCGDPAICAWDPVVKRFRSTGQLDDGFGGRRGVRVRGISRSEGIEIQPGTGKLIVAGRGEGWLRHDFVAFRVALR